MYKNRQESIGAGNLSEILNHLLQHPNYIFEFAKSFLYVNLLHIDIYNAYIVLYIVICL